MSKLDQIRALREAKAPPAASFRGTTTAVTVGPDYAAAGDGGSGGVGSLVVVPAPLKRRAKGTGRDPVKRRAYMRDLMRKRRAAKKEQGT